MSARALLTESPAHGELQTHASTLQAASITQLFNQDPERASDFTLDAAGLQLDYSKHLLSRPARSALYSLAQQAGLQQRIAALLAGDHVNNTEDRPALHSLLRASRGDGLEDKFKEVAAARARMRNIAERLNQGEHTGYSGAVITDVVNIGIGGSY